MLTLAPVTLAPLTLAPNTARVATEAVSLLSATGTQFPLYILFSIWFQYGMSRKVPATFVACAAVVAVVGPGFCRGATCWYGLRFHS